MGALHWNQLGAALLTPTRVRDVIRRAQPNLRSGFPRAWETITNVAEVGLNLDAWFTLIHNVKCQCTGTGWYDPTATQNRCFKVVTAPDGTEVWRTGTNCADVNDSIYRWAGEQYRLALLRVAEGSIGPGGTSGVAAPTSAFRLPTANPHLHKCQIGQRWDATLKQCVPGAGLGDPKHGGPKLRWSSKPQPQRVGGPGTFVLAADEYATVAQTYAELTEHLNKTISDLATSYGVTKAVVHGALHTASPTTVIGAHPWCKPNEANPGDPGSGMPGEPCGQPPMQAGNPKCCNDWWPEAWYGNDLCSPENLKKYPFRPRPPCETTIVKWEGDTSQVDVGAYQTGLNALIGWGQAFDASLPAVNVALKLAPGNGGKDDGKDGKDEVNLDTTTTTASKGPGAGLVIGGLFVAGLVVWMIAK